MTWQTLGEAVLNKTMALGTTFGLGGGVGIVKFLSHAPAPMASNAWSGSIFDTLQDLVSNKERIGERRNLDGTTVFVVRQKRPDVI